MNRRRFLSAIVTATAAAAVPLVPKLDLPLTFRFREGGVLFDGPTLFVWAGSLKWWPIDAYVLSTPHSMGRVIARTA